MADPLPVPRAQGRYVPAVVHGAIAYSAGMTPRVDGELVLTGRVGAEVSAEQAGEAAALAARNAVAAVALAAGGTDRIVRCLRLSVFVAAAPGFVDLSAVADGASGALADLLGERGEVARSAIGVAGLPGGAPVEVELTVALG